MPEVRTNKILASAGFKGGGKTYQTYKIIQKYINPQDGSAPRKVIIFDTQYEYNASSLSEGGFNFKIKTIRLSDLQKFILQQKVEAARILPILDNGKPMSSREKKDTAWRIIQETKGCLVCLDDINNYTLNVTQEEEFVHAIIGNAHTNKDILLNFQAPSMLNPILIRNLNELRLHYSSEMPGKDKFAEKWEMLCIAKFIIDSKFFQGGLNEKFCVWIDMLRFKIKGNFTMVEYSLACKRYVETWAPRLMRNELNKVSGTPQEKTNKALALAVKGLFIYWGN